MKQSRPHGLTKSAIFNQAQFDDFINQYLNQGLQFEQVVANKIRRNQNFTVQIIEEALTNKIKQFILELERTLCSVDKVTILKMYDHESDALFKPMIRILDIIPKEEIDDFQQCLKMMRITNYFMTNDRNYHNVHSDKKMRMYMAFMNYAQQKGLFEAASASKKAIQKDGPPYLDPSKVFPVRDHELIYRSFISCNCNVDVLNEQLQLMDFRNENGKLFTNEELANKIENMLLIGLYEIYRFIGTSQKLFIRDWFHFRQRFFIKSQLKPYYSFIMRTAVRSDPKFKEARKIAFLLGQRFRTNKQPKPSLRYNSFYEHVQTNIVKKRISEELKQFCQNGTQIKFLNPTIDEEDFGEILVKQKSKSLQYHKKPDNFQDFLSKYSYRQFSSNLSDQSESFDQFQGISSIYTHQLNNQALKLKKQREKNKQAQKNYRLAKRKHRIIKEGKKK